MANEVEVGSAAYYGFMDGLPTGGKAVVNGAAQAGVDLLSLGLYQGKVEVIQVTDLDRAYGYDMAAAFGRGGVTILMAVGTGGLQTVLSNGGRIAQAASGALNVFDAAGNLVGVIQGTEDMLQNGISLRGGLRVAASGLGLAGNANPVLRGAPGKVVDFAAEGGETGAKLYTGERLGKLEAYLARRKVALEIGSPDLPSGKAGAFIANPDGSARLLLATDPTNQLVWHELGHYIQWKQIGSEAYRALPRSLQFNAPEQFVFDLLENPSRWYRLTPEFRIRSAEYIEEVGGFR
jgi:hypothetical protein